MARRYLVSGILVLSGLLLHASMFDWDSRQIAGRYVEGATVSAFGVWPTDGDALPVALLVGLMVPIALLGLAAYLSRSFLTDAFGRLRPLLRMG